MSRKMGDLTICNDERKCWAKFNNRCTALDHTYEKSGDCPFCKENVNNVVIGKEERVWINFDKWIAQFGDTERKRKAYQ